MEVLTEMDEYFNAMSKINMDEPVMPYVKGRLVESDTYNKVQKILNTPELEKAHMYCYDLDLENLEECDVAKINNLYKLGVERGFIDDDLQYQDVADDSECSAKVPEVKEPEVQRNPRAKIPCFVAMYSAMKDGQIHTGEAYSRAISVQAAKSDVLNQLSKLGYTNISILAVEATEEDACCSCSVDRGSADLVADISVGGDTLGEDDYLKGRVHNNHLPEAEEAKEDEEKDSSAEDDSSIDDKTATDDSSEKTSDTEDDSSEDAETEAKDDDSVDSDEDDAGSKDDSAEDSKSEDADSEETASKDDDSDKDSEDSADEKSDDEDSEDNEDSEDKAEPEELDDNKKAELKDSYKRVFKNTMLKCKFEDKTFDDLTIAEKVKFFTELSKMWKEDHEPGEFMSDKEIDQLNKITIKK